MPVVAWATDGVKSVNRERRVIIEAHKSGLPRGGGILLYTALAVIVRIIFLTLIAFGLLRTAKTQGVVPALLVRHLSVTLP